MFEDIKEPTFDDLQFIEDGDHEKIDDADALLNSVKEGISVDEYDGSVYNSRRIFGSRIA